MSRIHVLLKPLQRQTTPHVPLLRQVVDQFGHRSKLDAVTRSAVMSPAVPAIGKNRDLIVSLSTRHFFSDEIGDFRRVFDQFGVRRYV